MISKIKQMLARSWQHVEESAVTYSAVTYSSGVCRPSKPFKGIHVGGSGDVVIEDLNGKTTTLKNLAEGTPYSYAGLAIHETDTTATDLVLLF